MDQGIKEGDLAGRAGEGRLRAASAFEGGRCLAQTDHSDLGSNEQRQGRERRRPAASKGCSARRRGYEGRSVAVVAEGGDTHNPAQSSKEGAAFQYKDSDLDGRRHRDLFVCLESPEVA